MSVTMRIWRTPSTTPRAACVYTESGRSSALVHHNDLCTRMTPRGWEGVDGVVSPPSIASRNTVRGDFYAGCAVVLVSCIRLPLSMLSGCSCSDCVSGCITLQSTGHQKWHRTAAWPLLRHECSSHCSCITRISPLLSCISNYSFVTQHQLASHVTSTGRTTRHVL